jgi:hypothetical protein
MTSSLSLWHLILQGGGRPLLIAFLPLYLFALIKGDKTDRACAHVLAISAVLSLVLGLDKESAGRSWPYGSDKMGIDTLLLVAQITIALRSSRHYPIVIAAAQLLIVIAGALNTAGLIAHESTLSMVFAGAGLIQMGAFAGGLIAHRKRCRPGTTATVFEG